MSGTGSISDLNFSDRLETTSSIADAYKKANPCSTSDASKYAKEIESTARKTALTLAEYHKICADAVHALLASKAADLAETVDEDVYVPPGQPETGLTIGEYKRASHYQDGLFSEVFKAVDPKTMNVVALKVTTPSMMQPPHDAIKEARILAAATSAHVIPLLHHFQQGPDRFVLVFPFMPFGLDGLLYQGRLDKPLQKTVLKDLFSALEHLHNMNIIHRDVKPSNILLASPKGPAYLSDFGIAWSATENAHEAADQKVLDVGTTSYRPPELLFGHQAYSTAVDMWAAGCVAAQVVRLNSTTLFDAGDLGSELALIKSMFETLGTPTLETWPEAKDFPDWGKMNFTQYPGRPWEDILPGAEPSAIDLVRKLVVYESGSRLKAGGALKHDYLRSID